MAYTFTVKGDNQLAWSGTSGAPSAPYISKVGTPSEALLYNWTPPKINVLFNGSVTPLSTAIKQGYKPTASELKGVQGSLTIPPPTASNPISTGPTTRTYVISTTRTPQLSGGSIDVPNYKTVNLLPYKGISQATGQWMPDPKYYPAPPPSYPYPDDFTIPLDSLLPPVKSATRYGGLSADGNGMWDWLAARKMRVWNTGADPGNDPPAWQLLSAKERSYRDADIAHQDKDYQVIQDVAKYTTIAVVGTGLAVGAVSAAIPASGAAAGGGAASGGAAAGGTAAAGSATAGGAAVAGTGVAAAGAGAGAGGIGLTGLLTAAGGLVVKQGVGLVTSLFGKKTQTTPTGTAQTPVPETTATGGIDAGTGIQSIPGWAIGAALFALFALFLFSGNRNE